jgi:transitional endoplasmic reticulum ATPase
LLEENIRDHVESSDFNVTRLVEEIIGLPIKSDLTIADNFPHMEKQVEKIIKALKYAAKHKIKGVNVLLHGPIGSGKTELARAMLVEAGLKGYAVGEDEDSNIQYGGMGTKIDSSKRLFRLKQAQRFLADTDDSGCVIDEIEDLLIKGEDSSKSADSSSKILLNRALEDNNVPTIWIGNDLGKFHESFRQRFKFPLFVGYQPTLVREKIWNHHITKNNLKLGRGASLKLARMFESPPRVISQACETAELIGGSFDDVIHQVQDKATIDFNGDRSGYNAQYPVPSRYRLSLLNSDSDLKQLKDDVVQASNDLKPLTVLVEGDRKVGKSTLAYYFAECAQMHIVEYDVQMLKTPTQQTEPVDHISMIFANAAKTNAILVIDGMEALFTGIETRDKDGMIERFMDCLETHTAPVILTQSSETQMSQEFRRFIDYTVTLDKIDGKQLVSAFKSYTGKRPTKSAQTPTAIGDIARAARSAKAMGGERGIIERRIAASATVASTIKAGIGIK